MSMVTGEWVDGVWVKEYDTVAGTYTERDTKGKVTLTRPLTVDEVAELADLEADGVARDALRIAAGGTGTFASAAVRDAVIRACARAILRAGR